MRRDRTHRPLGLWITAAALALAALICFFLLRWWGGRLSAQQEAERWRGESGLKFSQVTCFVPVDEKQKVEAVYQFRQDMQKKLHEAAMDIDYAGRLWVDAWSTSGKVQATSELGKGEARAIAVGGEFFSFHPVRLLSGGYLTEDDLTKDRVLLDEELAWLLFGGTQLQGLELKLNGVPFVVGGVVEREQDGFSRLAYTAGMGLYMSFDAYAQLNEAAGIDCYEFVCAEPVKGFALSLARGKFPIGQGVIVQNTGRFSVPRLLDVLQAYSTRSMQTQGVIYPYWENAARCAEDRCALTLLLGTLFALFPAGLGLWVLVRFLRRGKAKLSEDVLPVWKDKAEEAVRVRQRRAWERRRGKHEKREQ